MKNEKMNLTLVPIAEEDLKQYKRDMQEAFLLGAIEEGFLADNGEILPEADIDRSLSEKGAIAYKAVQDGKIVGGAIVVIDEEHHKGDLHFLYVKHGIQSRGIGRFMWFEIEKLHPTIQVWETCTPYFEKRNIHFYINVCGFHITEFWNEYHKDVNSHFDDGEDHDDNDGMFGFRKEITHQTH